MIGVTGNYLLSVSIGEFKDFLTQDTLHSFTVIEDAGNLLPTFQASIIATSKIAPYLNEGNAIKITLGATLDTLVETEFKLTKVLKVSEGHSANTYNIAGILNADKYTTQPVTQIYTQSSCIEAITQAIAGTLRLDTNILFTNDRMNWIQHNISTRKFINDTYLRMNLGKSFPAIAISLDNKFIIKDVKKSISGLGVLNYDWRLTPSPSRSTDIIYDGDYVEESNAGIINNWLGYGKRISQYNIEDNAVEDIEPELGTGLLAMTNVVAIDTTIEYRYGGIKHLNPDVHDKYHESHLHNLTQLAINSKHKITCKGSSGYKAVRPLDTAMLIDKDTTTGITTDATSGLYLITKVSRTIIDNTLTTLIQAVRESDNNIKVF